MIASDRHLLAGQRGSRTAKAYYLPSVVLGCEPVTWMAGSMSPPLGTSEYDMVGALRGDPVEVVHLPLSGLPVPGVFFNGLITVIALRQRYAGHAKQALITAAGLRHGDMKTYYATVDEDIDPTNLNEVLWAMCTRVDPAPASTSFATPGPRISIRVSHQQNVKPEISR